MELRFDEAFGKMSIEKNDYNMAKFIFGRFMKEVVRSTLKFQGRKKRHSSLCDSRTEKNRHPHRNYFPNNQVRFRAI